VVQHRDKKGPREYDNANAKGARKTRNAKRGLARALRTTEIARTRRDHNSLRLYVCVERIVNTLDSSLHFTLIALSLNISGLMLRQLLICGDFIVRVPQPWRSSADHYERARASNISLGICNESFASSDE